MALTQEKIEKIKGLLEGLSQEEQQKKFQEILTGLEPEEQEQLLGKQQCPFCLMAQGTIPVKKVYEDETILAVLDIHPANKGHTLLFPKEHHSILSTVPEPLVAHLFRVAHKLSTALFNAVAAQGTNIFVANGPAAGQTAPHVLVHVIPRFTRDTVVMQWEAQKITDEEMAALADVIQKTIPKDEAKGFAHKKEKDDETTITDITDRIP